MLLHKHISKAHLPSEAALHRWNFEYYLFKYILWSFHLTVSAGNLRNEEHVPAGNSLNPQGCCMKNSLHKWKNWPITMPQKTTWVQTELFGEISAEIFGEHCWKTGLRRARWEWEFPLSSLREQQQKFYSGAQAILKRICFFVALPAWFKTC